jgi:hypothetical protein
MGEHYEPWAAVTGGSHDTLRHELAEALADYDQNEYSTASYGYQADAMLPVVLRFADVQVAAERERLAAALAMWHRHRDGTPLGLPCECVGCHMGRVLEAAQP